VSSTSLDPDEIRAAAEVHRELGPDYQSAVIESFLDKVGKEIDARVDARMAEVQQFRRVRGQSPMTLPIVSLVFGIPLTAISAGAHRADRARGDLGRHRGDQRGVRAACPAARPTLTNRAKRRWTPGCGSGS